MGDYKPKYSIISCANIKTPETKNPYLCSATTHFGSNNILTNK